MNKNKENPLQYEIDNLEDAKIELELIEFAVKEKMKKVTPTTKEIKVYLEEIKSKQNNVEYRKKCLERAKSELEAPFDTE